MPVAELKFDELFNLADGQIGAFDVACPLCGPSRKSKINKVRKVLRVWFNDENFISYCCARCGAEGYAKRHGGVMRAKPRAKKMETPVTDRAELARILWSQSLPLDGSLAAVYLKCRRCFVESPNLRYLPPSWKHPPTMVAKFNNPTREVSGIHLTCLRDDGTDKANIEKPKRMIGPSKGSPIVVWSPITWKREHYKLPLPPLFITEGIEDAASIAAAITANGGDCCTWAAGSASRIPFVVERSRCFPRVFVATDNDEAGEKAWHDSLKRRSDLISVNFTMALQSDVPLDANKVMIQRGASMVRACIEWNERRMAA